MKIDRPPVQKNNWRTTGGTGGNAKKCAPVTVFDWRRRKYSRINELHMFLLTCLQFLNSLSEGESLEQEHWRKTN
jgi:hypothetical protein